MPEGPPSWDVATMYSPTDLTSKFAVLYLFVSVIGLATRTFVFLPTVIRFGQAVAAAKSRYTSSTKPSTMEGERDEAAAIEADYLRLQAAIARLRKWAQQTVLVILVFTATELTDLFRGIALTKMTGVSALAGTWFHVFSLWVPALWFITALCVASWILNARLARSGFVRSRFPRWEN
jgi:hypothetical protein